MTQMVGVCDELEVTGCTDGNSPNFDPYATDDDGTCLVGGCTCDCGTNAMDIPKQITFSLRRVSSVLAWVAWMCGIRLTDALVPNLALCTYPAGQFLDCDGNCDGRCRRRWGV